MMLTRRNFLLAASTLPFIPVSAQALTEGQEYHLVQPPLKTLDPKRVEVLEFFWYGCPHCFALEPDLNAWLKTLPKGVYIRRVRRISPNTGRDPAGARLLCRGNLGLGREAARRYF